jgi:hypothetical protein
MHKEVKPCLHNALYKKMQLQNKSRGQITLPTGISIVKRHMHTISDKTLSNFDLNVLREAERSNSKVRRHICISSLSEPTPSIGCSLTATPLNDLWISSSPYSEILLRSIGRISAAVVLQMSQKIII